MGKGGGVQQGCGGGGGFIFFLYSKLTPEDKPLQSLLLRSVCEDVGAEHYGQDNSSPAQCNGIRRVENSMQGHHSRSNGPEKETFGL